MTDSKKPKRRSLVKCQCGRKWEFRIANSPMVNDKKVVGYWCKACDTLEEK